MRRHRPGGRIVGLSLGTMSTWAGSPGKGVVLDWEATADTTDTIGPTTAAEVDRCGTSDDDVSKDDTEDCDGVFGTSPSTVPSTPGP